MSEDEQQTWNLSKILYRRIFRLKILHRQFHLIFTVLVRKNTKIVWKWRNLHSWQKFYTAAGTDGTDKFHLWGEYKMLFLFNWLQYHFNLVCVLTITTNCNSTMTRVGRKSGLCALMTHSAVAATIPRLQITANIHEVQEIRLTFHNLFWCQCLGSVH